MTNTNDRADVAAERERFEAAMHEMIDMPTAAEKAAAWKAWKRRAAISSAVPDGGKGEAVYQMQFIAGNWEDVTKEVFDQWTSNLKPECQRIVYTAPQAECAPGALTDAIDLTIKTLERQLDLIAERAPGNYLDKTPIVRSLRAHKQRLERALEQAVHKGAGNE